MCSPWRQVARHVSRMRFCAILFCLVVAALIGPGCARKESAPAKVGLRKIALQTDWFPQAEHGGFIRRWPRDSIAKPGWT